MSIGRFALIYGVVFLLVGIAGFIPGLVIAPGAGAPQGADHGLLLGLFPVNALHNLVHVAFGIWGIAVFRSWSGARIYARSVAVIYAVLGVMGLIPALQTAFGLVPLYGHDVWLHFLLAAIAAYFGWFAARPVTTERTVR
jgi:hypothetical protein